MATEKEMHELIGRAVVNVEFRAKLLENPEQAVKEAGFNLTPEQLKSISGTAGKGLAAVLEERLPKTTIANDFGYPI